MGRTGIRGNDEYCSSMSLGKQCLRWYFGITALALGVPGLMGLYLAWDAQHHGLEAGWLLRYGSAFALALAVVSGLAFARFERFARAAARLHLIFFPIGTVAGLLGLRALNAGTPRPQRPATHPSHSITQQWVFQLAQWATAWGLFHLAALRWHVSEPFPAEFAVPFAMAISAILHESGHIVGAWLAGWSVRAVRIGPVLWRRTGDSSQFALVPMAIGGTVQAIPATAGDLRHRALIVAGSGPLLSAFGAFSFLSAVSQGAMGELGLLLGSFCATDALFQWLPVGPLEGAYADGARFWPLWRNSAFGRYLEFGLYRGLSTTAQLWPGDWPEERVEAAVRMAQGEPAILRERLLAIIHYRVRGRLQRAHDHHQLMLQVARHADEEVAVLFAAEFAFYEALYAGRPGAAREWLDRIADCEPAELYRANCAVLAAERDWVGARQAWQHGWAAVQAMPLNGMRLVEEHDYRLLAEQWFPDLSSLARMLTPDGPTALNAGALRPSDIR